MENRPEPFLHRPRGTVCLPRTMCAYEPGAPWTVWDPPTDRQRSSPSRPLTPCRTPSPSKCSDPRCLYWTPTRWGDREDSSSPRIRSPPARRPPTKERGPCAPATSGTSREVLGRPQARAPAETLALSDAEGRFRGRRPRRTWVGGWSLLSAERSRHGRGPRRFEGGAGEEGWGIIIV